MKKISSKISIVIICCSCIAVLLVGSICFLKGSALIKADAQEKLIWMSRQYAAQFSSELLTIEDKVQELEVHIKDTIDVDALYTDPNYLEKYETQLAEYVGNFAQKRTNGTAAWCYFNPELSKTPHDVYYADGDNDNTPDRQNYIPFSYFNNTPTPTDDKYWWYGPVQAKKPVWTNPYEWTLANNQVIKVASYASPIYIDDKLICVVGTYYHFDEMNQEIKGINVYKSGYAALLNEKLDFIVHPTYFCANRNTSDNLATVEKGKFKGIRKELQENDYGIVSYAEGGEEQLTAYSKLSNGWIMTINPLTKEIYAGLHQLIMQLFIAVALCIAFSILMAWFMGKYIAKPLLQVVESSEKIGKGDLNTVVPISTKDEVKIVAEALNNMVANIKHLQKEQIELAYYDPLTGIANKNLFEKNAKEFLHTKHSPYAYIILDIKKFKIINNIFGFEQGDLLLKHIANVLSENQSENEICARFNADTFHLLLLYHNKLNLETRLNAIVKEIHRFDFGMNEEYKLSIGFGVYVIDGRNHRINDVGSMGDNAKLALSKIKTIHGTSVHFYNDDIRNKIIEEQEIENTMENALRNNEFKLYLQPKYSISERRITGAEVLTRWENSTKMLIFPDAFIPVFESNGFILQLDIYVLEQACLLIKSWQAQGLPVVPISVNQSRHYLHHPTYITTLVDIFGKYEIPHAMIELEITETAFFENQEEMIKIIENLHRLGFRISMDDFGSGYSSLNMLQNILVDVLKIDKKFFDESIDSARGRKIVENVITMANGLNIEVVAEGVETQAQIDFLKATNCDIVQGYYFSKPLSIDDFNQMMALKE